MKPYKFYFSRLKGIKTYSLKVRKCDYFYFFVLWGLFKTGRLLIFSNFPPRTLIQDRALIVFGQFPPRTLIQDRTCIRNARVNGHFSFDRSTLTNLFSRTTCTTEQLYTLLESPDIKLWESLSTKGVTSSTNLPRPT